MTRATFLLAKDPLTQNGGDIELSRLVMRLAAESFDVSAICLSAEPAGSVTGTFAPGGVPVRRVDKPQVSAPRLFVSSAARRHSLVHTRFDTPALRRAIDEAETDVVVAEHSYMAESLLASQRFAERRFVLNTHISESLVWGATRGALGRVERPRIARDETRVALAADAVGAFDADEADAYRRLGVTSARWIDLTMEPAQPLDLTSTVPRLVFLGTRDWPPNQEAFLRALALWPKISAGIPDAELVIVGGKARGAPEQSYPDGVRDLGFVDDLPSLLSTCRAMVAPVLTGGGVRVKILEAARMGLPVIGTGAAIGSLGPLFGLTAFDSESGFVEESRRLLLSQSAAVAAGQDLYERNATHWSDRGPHQTVERLLGAAPPV